MESLTRTFPEDQNGMDESSSLGKSKKKSKSVSNGEGKGNEKEIGGCEGKEEEVKNSRPSSSLMLGLLEEFTKIYSDRLQRVEQTAMKCDEKQYLEVRGRLLMGHTVI